MCNSSLRKRKEIKWDLRNIWRINGKNFPNLIFKKKSNPQIQETQYSQAGFFKGNSKISEKQR